MGKCSLCKPKDLSSDPQDTVGAECGGSTNAMGAPSSITDVNSNSRVGGSLDSSVIKGACC